MCFNVRYGTADDGPNRWEHRGGLAVRTIRRFDPDVLGVQEALRFQADALREALPEYGFFGAGRDDGRDAGEICGVFFRLGRFERLDAGNFWLSETPDRPGSRGWDADLPRVATWVRLRDLRSGRAGSGGAAVRREPGERRTGERDAGALDPRGHGAGTLLFVNTHWDYAGKRARTESARLMRRTIQSVQPAGPVVVVGDFNGTEDDEPYAQLLRGHGDESDRGPCLVDSYRRVHPQRLAQEATFHGFTGGRDGSRIDWILHTEDLCTLEADIDPFNEDGRYPSDHFPITAVLAPKPEPESAR
jgi:endonuclease/exonuclease/phosphatase family metal-dependent hydrolase